MLLLALLSLVIGIINIVSPETGWKISKGWQFKDAEPSEAALEWGKIGGVILIVVSVVLFVKFFSGGA